MHMKNEKQSMKGYSSLYVYFRLRFCVSICF